MTTEIITSLFWLQESSRTFNMRCLKNNSTHSQKIKNKNGEKERALPSPSK